MSRTSNIAIVVFWIVGIAAIVGFSLVQTANANPDQFLPCSTATATTTLTYMTAGTATTTLTCDTQTDGGLPAKDAILLVNWNASSTASKVNFALEYSQDGTAGTWFADTFSIGVPATTTAPVMLNTLSSYSWQFASSSIGGRGLDGTEATSTRALHVPTPTRYVRIVMTVPVGATPSAIWAALIEKKEIR
jgi:hypothetical protein